MEGIWLDSEDGRKKKQKVFPRFLTLYFGNYII